MLKTDIKNFILDHRKDGKRECFMWDKEGLDFYMNWAFYRNYLFYVLDENGASGVGVAYPIPKKFDGSIDSLLPYEEELVSENDKDLVIMDWVAVNSNGRKSLVNQFKRRFLNWENQDKYGIHYGKPKRLSNNYINKLTY